MAQATKPFSILPSMWQPSRTTRIRVGALPCNTGMYIGNLDQKQPVSNFSEIPEAPLLILTVSQQSVHTRRVLQNVAEVLYRHHHPLHRLDPKQAVRLFQSHLSLERRFFEDEKAKLSQQDYQGFILMDHKIYPLHVQSDEMYGYIYREGRLLTYPLESHQFISLQPEDLFFLAPPDTMTHLLDSDALGYFYQIFQQKPFSNPTFTRGFQKLKALAQGPLFGFQLADAKLEPETSFQYHLTRNQKLLLLFFAYWGIALIAAQWLNS